MARYSENEDEQYFINERLKYQPIYENNNRPTPRPLSGEGLTQFRLRMLSDTKNLVPEYKDVNFHGMDPSALKLMEPKVIEAAIRELQNPTNVPEGTLKEIKKMDQSGRPYSVFFGKPSSWMDQFTTGARNKKLVGIRIANQGYHPNN